MGQVMKKQSRHLKYFLQYLLVVFFLAMPGLAAQSRPAGAQSTNVSLVLICDIYEMKARKGRGGFARLAAALKEERARTKHVFIAHAGDTISPSLMSGFDRGAHIIDLLNGLKLDFFVPGNHEFDFGKEIFKKRMAEARFPLFAANLRDADGSKLAGFEDAKLYRFANVTIGVMGLTAENSVQKSDPGDLKFRSSLETAKEIAADLRSRGADIVVAVAHAGRRMDLKLLRSGVLDILLSGDDHDLFVHYDGKTAMIEAKEEGEFLVAIDLKIDVKGKGKKRRVKWWPGFRIVDTADFLPDPQMTRKVARYQRTLSKELDIVIGTTATKLDSRNSAVRRGEAAIGNLITDAMRAATGADMALFHGGAIRGHNVYDPGYKITRRDILTELPFRNTNVVLDMSGADILKILENGLWYAGKTRGRFLQVSGLRIKADGSQVPGRRIISVMVGDRPLDPAARYKVSTNDFIAKGVEGFAAFRNAKILIGKLDGKLIANDVMVYIRKAGTVAPKIEGRIIID